MNAVSIWGPLDGLLADAVRALVQTFVHCRLDYCNSLLAGAADIHFKRLQLVQSVI